MSRGHGPQVIYNNDDDDYDDDDDDDITYDAYDACLYSTITYYIMRYSHCGKRLKLPPPSSEERRLRESESEIWRGWPLLHHDLRLSLTSDSSPVR